MGQSLPRIAGWFLVGLLVAFDLPAMISALGPSIVISVWSPRRSWPLKTHLPPPRSWYALMRPLPKLPIRRSPLKTPKLAGAIASPHGAFGGAFLRPPLATRATSWPSSVNWST